MSLPSAFRDREPFSFLDDREYASLAGLWKTMDWRPGKSLLDGKDPGGTGILSAGYAQLMVLDRQKKPVVCGMIGAGDLFGVTALVNDGLPLIDVISRGAVKGYWLEKASFESTLTDHLHLREYYYHLAASRMRDALRVLGSGQAMDASLGWPPAIRRAVAFIETRYDQPLDLETVAGRSGMSRYHFSRQFKEHVGSGFRSYLNRIRVKRAAELMRSRGRNVSEACFAVGFNDLSYFSRHFKSVYGETPSAYRKGLYSE